MSFQSNQIPSLLGPSFGGGGASGASSGILSQVDYKVSSNTNSTEPEAVNARIFVGGLNTTQLTKADVAQVFKRYGRVTAVSMHKGYAFVQFMDPSEARQAVLGEDQRVYANQTIDVNIVSEPKFNRQQKKQTPDYGESQGQRSQGQTNNIPIQTAPEVKKEKVTIPDSSQMMRYNSPDILICGNCKSMFQGIEALAEHKNRKCELKPASDKPQAGSLQCANCLMVLDSPWTLVQHVQSQHGMAVYSEYELPQQTNGN